MAVNRKRLDLGAIQIASYGRPFPGERVSGDGAVVVQHDSKILLAMIDALGHGPAAHEVAILAVKHLAQAKTDDLMALFKNLHQALQGSIGAAVGLGSFDTENGRFDYLGIGNTVARGFGSQEKRLVSMDGIVGEQWRAPNPQALTLYSGDVLLMYSDGISDRFSLSDYPQLIAHGAAAVARGVVDRFGKEHDDATCLVLKYGRK